MAYHASPVFACLLTNPALAARWVVEGRVVGLFDGETLTILDRARTHLRIDGSAC